MANFPMKFLNVPNATSVQLLATVSTIVLDKRIFSKQGADEAFVPNGLDLVPWRPVVHAVMLKVLAKNLQCREDSTITSHCAAYTTCPR
jgi:ABC-type nitrate/sulfonate/bicarbonate transport system ATPase subunit